LVVRWQGGSEDDMRVKASGLLLVLAGGIAMSLSSVPPAQSQPGVPRVIEIDKLTCGEMLAAPSETVDRLLIYLDGYVNGMSNRTTWDERIEGEMINRVMAECKASPATSVLGVFIRASRR
jgi:HdeA/HdeB family